MKQLTSQQYELMKEGKSYHFDDFLLEKQKACAKKLCKINKLPFGSKRRERLLDKVFSRGENCIIKEGFMCNFGFNITMGKKCYLNYGVKILDSYKVEIGNNVFIGPETVITAVTHPLKAENRRELIIKKVVIEDDVWIGAGAIIFPGVTLHKGCVVGAGAIVRKDVDAYSVVVGVPAKELKKVKKDY